MGVRVVRRSFLALALVAAPVGASAFAGDLQERPDLDAVFRDQGAVGTSMLYDAAADSLTAVNRARAETRYVPASTFKIANSLIALETGVVQDESEIVPYGGKPQPIKAWERDMSIREAIAMSNVPIYQEIARHVASRAMAFGSGGSTTATARWGRPSRGSGSTARWRSAPWSRRGSSPTSLARSCRCHAARRRSCAISSGSRAERVSFCTARPDGNRR